MKQNSSELEERLFDMMWGHYVSASLRTAAELGIADHLKDAPRTAQEIASEVDCHARSLYRLMRALATVGIFERDGEVFSLTPLGNLLRSDIPRTQRGKVQEMCSYFDAWGKLTETMKSGKPPIENIYGEILNTEENARFFYQGMDAFHYDQPAPMLDCYDFSGFEVVADIGGASGSQLIAVLQRYPHLSGILFDLPETARRSQLNIEAANLADRCSAVGGNFFNAVPSGADIYLIRHVIHNWNDEKSIQILSNIRAVLPDHGRVLVIETLVDSPRDEEAFAPWWDLSMFVVDDGAERTEKEYAELFAKSGLKLERVIPTKVDVSVIEAVKGYA